MNHRHRMSWPAGLALFVCACAGMASRAGAAVVTSTPFRGVTLHQRTETSPRPLKINVIEINLADPDIRFRVTPQNGPAAGETTLQTTRAFLAEQNAQMAV